MRERNRDHVAAYRVALAAIDNAGAVPTTGEHRATAIEVSAVGVGAAEATRLELSDSDLHDVVRLEVDDLLRAADHLDPLDPDEADVKRSQAAALDRVLQGE